MLVALGVVLLAVTLVMAVVDLVGGGDGGDPCAGAELRSGCRTD